MKVEYKLPNKNNFYKEKQKQYFDRFMHTTLGVFILPFVGLCSHIFYYYYNTVFLRQ